MSGAEFKNRRRNFRIGYTRDDRPRFLCGDDLFEVLDISETGIRFLRHYLFTLKPGEPMAGTLKYPDGRTFPVEGLVSRVTFSPMVCALSLVVRIPLTLMMEEQRKVLLRGRS
jgi:hypothetical protein